MVVAALTAVADWIGSNESFLPPLVTEQTPLADAFDADDYSRRSASRAATALENIGWHRHDPAPTPRPFAEVTGLEDGPRPLQQRVIDLLDEEPLTQPRLFLIEAPMGEGKTEAAW